MRVFAAQRLRVKHPFDVNIVSVDALARNLRHRIRSGLGLADGAHRALDFGQLHYGLPCRLLNGANDGVVARATTDAKGVSVVNLFECGIGDFVQQGLRRHHKTRRANAALGRTLVNVGLLDGVQAAIGSAHTLNSQNVRTLGALHRHQARTHRFAILNHHATATMSGAAPIFGACQTQIIPNHVHQIFLRRASHLVGPVIHGQMKSLTVCHQSLQEQIK